MSRKTGFAPATEALIIKRDQGCCARCGKPVTHLERGIAWSIHHRCGRGMGGSKAPWINAASAGAILCGSGTTGCHGEVESDRQLSYDTGWLVRRNGRARPIDVPYLHAIHGYGRALDNGLFERITP